MPDVGKGTTMPLKDKNITEYHRKQIEEISQQRMLEFEQNDEQNPKEIQYLSPKDFLTKAKVEKNRKDNELKENYRKTIINDLSRISSQRLNFQRSVEEARRKSSPEMLGK